MGGVPSAGSLPCRALWEPSTPHRLPGRCRAREQRSRPKARGPRPPRWYRSPRGRKLTAPEAMTAGATSGRPADASEVPAGATPAILARASELGTAVYPTRFIIVPTSPRWGGRPGAGMIGQEPDEAADYARLRR